MAEDKAITEIKQANEEKPHKIWNGALRMVKGESTAKLIENFTAEMTLVAEGLCEDQSKLRREAEQARSENDRRFQRLESKIDMVESSLDQEKETHDRDLTELRERLAYLEKKIPREASRSKKKEHSRVRELTWLIAVAGAVAIIILVIVKFL